MSKETDRARKLRQTATTGEQAAWQTLRGFRQHGFPVRRQHPIGGLIVDFAIEQAKLVIEIDGSIHQRRDVQDNDAARDMKLSERGWRVVRVPNDQAFHGDFLFDLIAKELGLE